MDWDPKQVFDATHRLANALYREGLYLSPQNPTLPKERGLVLENNQASLPYQEPCACGTTGGLAIHTINFHPAWIECPWGEWQCWSWSMWSGRALWTRGNHEALLRLRESLDIDKERSREIKPGMAIWAIGRVDGIVLPAYRHCQPPRPHGEWIELCWQHDPPLPYPDSMDGYWRRWRAYQGLPSAGFV